MLLLLLLVVVVVVLVLVLVLVLLLLLLLLLLLQLLLPKRENIRCSCPLVRLCFVRGPFVSIIVSVPTVLFLLVPVEPQNPCLYQFHVICPQKRGSRVKALNALLFFSYAFFDFSSYCLARSLQSRCCGTPAGEGMPAGAAPPTSSAPPSRPLRASATPCYASAWTAWTTPLPTPCCSSRGRTSRYAPYVRRGLGVCEGGRGGQGGACQCFV